MHWRLHTAIFLDRLSEATDILDEFGDTYTIIDGNDKAFNSKIITNIQDTPTLGITTIQDTRNIHGTPGLYYHPTNYNVSNWLPNLDQKLPILNKSAIFLPSGLLPTIHTKLLLSIANNNQVFIRPDSGNKLFTGCSININNWDYNISHITSKLNKETMVVIAPHVFLNDIEWRCWIVNNKVVAYSPYSWNNNIKIDVRDAVPTNVLELATSVAEYSWQLDYTYVLDIVLDLNGVAYINEINATSTSGIYEVELDILLVELRNLAIAEYNELTE